MYALMYQLSPVKYVCLGVCVKHDSLEGPVNTYSLVRNISISTYIEFKYIRAF